MARKGYVLALAALMFTALANGAAAQGYSLLTGQGLAAARDAVAPASAPATPVSPDAGAAEGLRLAALDPALPVDTPRPGAGSAFGGAAGGLIRARAEIADTVAGEEALARGQSLFIGQAAQGFFAPFAPRDRSGGGGAGGYTGGDGPIASRYGPIRSDDPHAEMIRHVIAFAEAGAKGYDAVQYGARIKPGRPPTQMTLGEVFGWIKATPGQPHAIGRYQFIPSTLARLVTILDAGPNERFSPEMQDRLADILLQEAGLDRYRSGAMSRTGFMNNLAKIWAGLPNSTGRSHYDGYAGNAATMTWARFDAEMSRIFQG